MDKILPVASVTLNLILLLILWVVLHAGDGGGGGFRRTTATAGLSWSRKAAVEAEAVAAVTCSGHGTAFLDGVVAGGRPVCECYACFGGPDCSQLKSGCVADVDSGNPLFLEPFWKNHAASSAVVLPGWHRMAYSFSDGSSMSLQLENIIRQLHIVAGNAVTAGKFIVFGSGSTQLLNAAVHALSANQSQSPTARVVASIPFYPVYKQQTDWFQSANFKFEGDALLWKNASDSGMRGRFVEFVTSPNNPDGELKEPVLRGSNAKTVHDHAYYWPHYTAIPAPANGSLMLFTLSKLTGHAGSRFGWAVIKDEEVYKRMMTYMEINTIGVSHDTQLRAWKLLKTVIKGGGREIFEFGYETMSQRWDQLSKVLSPSMRLSIQKLSPMYCNYFHRVRGPSPAYAWLKCEKEEENCPAVLKEAGIIGRNGTHFYAGSRYMRLSLIKSQDDFDLLIHKLKSFVSQEDDGSKAI